MLSARKVKDKYGLDLHLHFDSFWFSTVKSVLHVAQDNFMDFHPACTAGVQPNSFSCSPLHKLLPAHVNAPGVMSTSFLSWHFKSWHLIFISFLTSEKLTENKLQEITNEMFGWRMICEFTGKHDWCFINSIAQSFEWFICGGVGRGHINNPIKIVYDPPRSSRAT